MEAREDAIDGYRFEIVDLFIGEFYRQAMSVF